MFGIGPMELIVIAIFAIVFIGPQNLPQTLSKFAKFFVKARRYSSDIKVGFDDMVRKAESEMRLEEVQANLDQLKKTSGIDGSSLKPLTSQRLNPPSAQSDSSGDGSAKKDASKGQQNSAAQEPPAEQDEDDALLFAGLPTHMGGRPVNPTFDNLDTAIEDERDATLEPPREQPERTPERQPEQRAAQEAEASPADPQKKARSAEDSTLEDQKQEQQQDQHHHEQMVKALQDKLKPPSEQS